MAASWKTEPGHDLEDNTGAELFLNISLLKPPATCGDRQIEHLPDMGVRTLYRPAR